MSDDERDKWVGRIVFVLACALSVVFIIAVVTIALSPVPFHGDSGRALGAGFGAILGIVAGYVLGRRWFGRRND